MKDQNTLCTDNKSMLLLVVLLKMFLSCKVLVQWQEHISNYTSKIIFSNLNSSFDIKVDVLVGALPLLYSESIQLCPSIFPFKQIVFENAPIYEFTFSQLQGHLHFSMRIFLSELLRFMTIENSLYELLISVCCVGILRKVNF